MADKSTRRNKKKYEKYIGKKKRRRNHAKKEKSNPKNDHQTTLTEKNENDPYLPVTNGHDDQKLDPDHQAEQLERALLIELAGIKNIEIQPHETTEQLRTRIGGEPKAISQITRSYLDQLSASPNTSADPTTLTEKNENDPYLPVTNGHDDQKLDPDHQAEQLERALLIELAGIKNIEIQPHETIEQLRTRIGGEPKAISQITRSYLDQLSASPNTRADPTTRSSSEDIHQSFLRSTTEKIDNTAQYLRLNDNVDIPFSTNQKGKRSSLITSRQPASKLALDWVYDRAKKTVRTKMRNKVNKLAQQYEKAKRQLEADAKKNLPRKTREYLNLKSPHNAKRISAETELKRLQEQDGERLEKDYLTKLEELERQILYNDLDTEVEKESVLLKDTLEQINNEPRFFAVLSVVQNIDYAANLVRDIQKHKSLEKLYENAETILLLAKVAKSGDDAQLNQLATLLNIYPTDTVMTYATKVTPNGLAFLASITKRKNQEFSLERSTINDLSTALKYKAKQPLQITDIDQQTSIKKLLKTNNVHEIYDLYIELLSIYDPTDNDLFGWMQANKDKVKKFEILGEAVRFATYFKWDLKTLTANFPRVHPSRGGRRRKKVKTGSDLSTIKDRWSEIALSELDHVKHFVGWVKRLGYLMAKNGYTIEAEPNKWLKTNTPTYEWKIKAYDRNDNYVEEFVMHYHPNVGRSTVASSRSSGRHLKPGGSDHSSQLRMEWSNTPPHIKRQLGQLYPP